MVVLCCKIRYLTIFCLLFYFMPMVVGPLNELVFENYEHGYCYHNIIAVFKVAVEEFNVKQAYLTYAILFLRYPNEAEINRYIVMHGLTPAQQENLVDLLCNGRFYMRYVIEAEKYANKYYRYLSDKYVKVLDDELSPANYCDNKAECIYGLWYYGFRGNFENITSNAFSNVVENDIDINNNFRDESVPKPSHDGHMAAAMYIDCLSSKIRIIEAAMQLPFEYCKNPV